MLPAVSPPLNTWNLFLDYQHSRHRLSASEPQEFVYDTDGWVVALEEDDTRHVLGRFHVVYLDIEQALNESLAVFDVFDTHQYTVEYLEAIFASCDGEPPNPRLTALFGNELHYIGNVLIINRLEIRPQYRGRGIGLLAMRALIQRFSSGASVVAIKPFPLQFEAGHGNTTNEWRATLLLDRFSRNERLATSALRKYYGRLGFRRLPGTPFMFLWTAERLPRVRLRGDA